MRLNIDRIKCRLYVIIFKSNTKPGKAFDVALLGVIMLNLAVVMLDSISSIHDRFGNVLYFFEWFITGVFLLEYVLRIWIINHKLKYIISFYGLIDLLSILPSFIGLIFPGAHFLSVIRTLRLLRIFSIFQLSDYSQQGNLLIRSIVRSWSKISVFLLSVISAITVIGTMMYLIEGEQNGFTSIPVSIYWTIVTITTVGYGDISPVTPLGQFIASITMVIGYAIIAVPTGIITAEAIKPDKAKIKCPRCLSTDIDSDSNYCKVCGNKLKE